MAATQQPAYNTGGLPPGRYLLAVFGYWPEGDAIYVFAIDVKE